MCFRELQKHETKVKQLQGELDARAKEVKTAENKERSLNAQLQQAKQQAKEKIRSLEVG